MCVQCSMTLELKLWGLSPTRSLDVCVLCTRGFATDRPASTVPLNGFIKKAVPLHAMKALGGGEEYSSYSYSTSALDWGEWSASRSGRALDPGKGPPIPIVQEAGWDPEPVWTQRLDEKSFVPAGDRTPIARSSSP
jgi:hypothetical protein